MKRLGLVVKYIAIGFLLVILVLALFPLGKSGSLKKANADSSNAYPGVCLGGWQDPNNAAGTPDVPPGGDSFTVDNSAVLNQTQAQIFCGSFQASDQSETPASVTLHLSWNVIFADETPPSTSTDTDSAAWSGVLDATSSASSSPSSPSSTPTAATTSTPPAPTSTPTVSTPPPAPTTASTSTSTSTPTPTPPPTPPAPTSSPSDSSSTSFLQNILNDPLGFFIQKTFADSSDTAIIDDTSTAETSTPDTSTTTDDISTDASNTFMDVSYSLDGTTWIDLGQVSESDWQDYSVTIPVSSWNDINNLQVQLSPLITTDPPTIYLDGMWLEVDDNQSVLGDLQNGADAALNAMSDLSNSVDNALSDLLPSPTPSPAPQNSTVSPAPVAPPPPPPPAHQYSFLLQGTQSIKVGNLPWVPEDIASGSAPTATVSTAPTVSLPATNTIQISGTCTAAYYTILIFANPTDYKDDPVAALYNNANKCVDGSFSWTIGDMDLPPQLTSGTYYLVVANQGVKGPWVPDPEIYPIQLSTTSPSASSSSQ